jgi:hypothetical protein
MKIFLHGNSMGLMFSQLKFTGGLITIQACRKNKTLVDGVVLTGALVFPANPPNIVVIKVAQMLNYFMPTTPLVDALSVLK